MRTALVAAVLPLALLAAGCGSKKSASSLTIETDTAQSMNACAKVNLPLAKTGVLTIGTDNPAYPPWYGGGTPKGSSWKVNDPSTGKGYESAVAYAVAKKLGFSRSQVHWTYVPFNKA